MIFLLWIFSEEACKIAPLFLDICTKDVLVLQITKEIIFQECLVRTLQYLWKVLYFYQDLCGEKLWWYSYNSGSHGILLSGFHVISLKKSSCSWVYYKFKSEIIHTHSSVYMVIFWLQYLVHIWQIQGHMTTYLIRKPFYLAPHSCSVLPS